MNEKQRKRAWEWQFDGREAFRNGVAFDDCPYKRSLYGAYYYWRVGWLLESDHARNTAKKEENNNADSD